MKQADDETIKRDYAIITDAWKCMHKWLKQMPEGADEWKPFCDEVNQLCKKYNEDDFPTKILLAVLGEIERMVADD